MTRANRFVGAALACWVALTGASIVYAQRTAPVERPAPPADRPAPPATGDRAPARAMRAKNVLGSKVSIQGGLSIGTVDEVVFDDDGYIDYLVVLNDGKYVTVPWEAAKFDFENRTATVDVPQEKWKDIPTYTAEKYPNFYEPSYQEKVYTYYGVKPRRERRR